MTTRPNPARSADDVLAVRIIKGDALTVLKTLPSESVQVCVTSPPYFGLRSYGTNPQIWGGDPDHAHEWGESIRAPWANEVSGPSENVGKNAAVRSRPKEAGTVCPCGAWRGEFGSEPTPALFIEHLLTIFDEVKRVLRPDGLCFVNLGDSMSGSGKGPSKNLNAPTGGANPHSMGLNSGAVFPGIPAKNLLLIPERFAIGMQDRGWWVRSRIAWCKTSAMPESVRDRPTSAWEHIWMFSRSRTYYYDADAVRTNVGVPMEGKASFRTGGAYVNGKGFDNSVLKDWQHNSRGVVNTAGANLRNFWLLGPEPSSLEHYAGFPTELPKRCILAGTSDKGACIECGAPWMRATGERVLDVARPQSRRALEMARGAGLTDDHIAAIRAVGTSDTGKSAATQTGSGKNSADVLRLAAEAKAALGGYFREFLLRKPTTIGWRSTCQCETVETRPCVVLDPFLGSGTTALVADRLGRRAIGIELSPDYAEMARRRIENDAGPLWSDPVEIVSAEAQASLWEAVV